MTNYEKYKNEIEKITCLGISFGFNKKTGKFDACYNIANCEDCKFYTERSCLDKKLKWAYSEYIEPEVDWSTGPVDTPVLVSDDGTNWVKGYFAKYKDGKIYAFTDDAHRGIVRGQQAEIVRKWAEEHPQKTMKDILLEKFPNAKLDSSTQRPLACAFALGLCPKCTPFDDCEECWNTEVEE